MSDTSHNSDLLTEVHESPWTKKIVVKKDELLTQIKIT